MQSMVSAHCSAEYKIVGLMLNVECSGTMCESSVGYFNGLISLY